METHQLLFELSHPVRFEIMKIIAQQPLRLTKIGEKVDANNPEVFRHLDRLKNANLVEKNADGYYSTTSYGRLIFSMLPRFSFIANHPGYFFDPEHGEQIAVWFRTFEDVEDHVKVVTLDEIKGEGWTLNISRYVLPLLVRTSHPCPRSSPHSRRFSLKPVPLKITFVQC